MDGSVLVYLVGGWLGLGLAGITLCFQARAIQKDNAEWFERMRQDHRGTVSYYKEMLKRKDELIAICNRQIATLEMIAKVREEEEDDDD